MIHACITLMQWITQNKYVKMCIGTLFLFFRFIQNVSILDPNIGFYTTFDPLNQFSRSRIDCLDQRVGNLIV